MVQNSAALLCSCLLGLLALSPATGTAVFPSLRKRREAIDQGTQLLSIPKANASKVDVAAKEDASAEQPAATVPAPMAAGADGFPQLPSVDDMLGKATNTMKTVNAQTDTISQQMAEAQRQSEALLARQKAAFEQNLKLQEMKNQEVQGANAKIAVEIEGLKKANDGLRSEAKKVQDASAVLRRALHSLGSKMGSAKEFAHKTLTDLDDHKDSLLEVLRAPDRPIHHELAQVSRDDDDDEDSDDQDEDDGDDDNGKGGVALLEVSASLRRRSDSMESNFALDSFDAATALMDTPLPSIGLAEQALMNPDDILTKLTRDIKQLQEQRKASEKHLKDLFITAFRAGAKRKMALMSQQKALNTTRGDLIALQTKLKTALAHVESTHKDLHDRLHSLGQFLRQLSHVANANEHEMSHLLTALPKDVPSSQKPRGK